MCMCGLSEGDINSCNDLVSLINSSKNIVRRFVGAIQSLYLYLLDVNCCNPIVFIMVYDQVTGLEI